MRSSSSGCTMHRPSELVSPMLTARLRSYQHAPPQVDRQRAQSPAASAREGKYARGGAASMMLPIASAPGCMRPTRPHGAPGVALSLPQGTGALHGIPPVQQGVPPPAAAAQGAAQGPAQGSSQPPAPKGSAGFGVGGFPRQSSRLRTLPRTQGVTLATPTTSTLTSPTPTLCRRVMSPSIYVPRGGHNSGALSPPPRTSATRSNATINLPHRTNSLYSSPQQSRAPSPAATAFSTAPAHWKAQAPFGHIGPSAALAAAAAAQEAAAVQQATSQQQKTRSTISLWGAAQSQTLVESAHCHSPAISARQLSGGVLLADSTRSPAISCRTGSSESISI